ncbi:pentatricopeptide repeat-containing protein At1g80880, mitochondrial [Phalaenopsis equestris]|uniref:pentatricopeptide repeat-containing protein At1g80880, mitochondrial n=1 Tax=Phalaenopsis equestris TaxID=78828 RepID=UPI0009E463AC|nr:pentatricopeptide repeat-containing protein At1g80880, mitochondrial [Phalaenopsis equestris]
MPVTLWRRISRARLFRIFVPHCSPPLSTSAFPSFLCSTFFPSFSRFCNSHFYNSLSFHFPSSPEAEDSDFDSDSSESTSNFLSPDLPLSLHLLSQAKSKFSTHDEALAFLRSSSVARPTKGLLCSVLWELRRDWESAFLAFRWAGDCVLESPWAWHLLIWVLGKQRRFDLAWMVLRRMHRKSLSTRRALIVMMERYVSANEVGKAIKTFHALEKFNVKADLDAFYALLHALCKNKNVEDAEELLLLKREFFPLETAGFNIVLDGWCNILVDLVEAKRVWREMEKNCITPNITSYTCIIGCLAKHGKLFDSIRFYDEMKRRGWIPNLKVYNYLIYVLTSENCLKEACSIFNKIMEAGLQPDLETYNCMILPLCKARKLDEAHKMMKTMILGGVCPSIDTYHAFVEIEDFWGIFKLIERMKEDGNRPNQRTFLIIFNNLFGLGESENALRMWSEMSNYDVIPDIEHYITIIKGLAAHGWLPKAMEFYGEMKLKGFATDPELEQLFKGFPSNNKNHCSRGSEGYNSRKHGRKRIPRGLKLG